MIHNLGLKNSLVSQFVSELRDVNIQGDRLRFRRNLERIGEIMAYEISQKLKWEEVEVTTPLGIANCKRLAQQPVLATILRAGMPLHQGLLNYFDQADNAFIGAYRKHEKDGTFTIHMSYLTAPPMAGRVLIVSDPMLATGASLAGTLLKLQKEGKPSHIHIVTAIAASEGIAYVRSRVPNVTIWAGAIDEELTAKAYIVPGLGDAGDLAYGEKAQD
jgi:uracil phosphoribosyltransferase